MHMHTVDVLSLDTCEDDREKRDDIRSILRMNGVISIRLIFAVLCLKFDAPDRLRAAIFIVRRIAS
jgi:hypothetical protein